MKIIEKIKLLHRATQYKNKYDKGGIDYILNSVTAGQTVLDIGAHKAGYLYFMRQQVTLSGKVFAFEPQSLLYNYIVKIKQLFNWQNLQVEHLALSDAPGKVTLYIPSHKKMNTSSPGATIVAAVATNDVRATEEVETETLDAYCKRKNIQPNFLKIDVEGNELRIFKGGVQTLQQYKPKIMVEIEARHVGREQAVETFIFLQQLGYTAHFIAGIQRLPLKDFNFDTHQNIDDMKNYCNNFIFE